MDPNDPLTQTLPKPTETIKPSNLFDSTPQPAGPTPPPPPTQPSQKAPYYPPPKSNKLKKIILIGAAIVVIGLILVAVLASSSGNNKKQQDTKQTPTTPELVREPSAIDIENTNNSISSDISGLDDDKDFPEANLNDKNLEL